MIRLLSHFEVHEKINLHLQLRRLNLYSIEQLKDVYFFEKKKVLVLYRKISKIYDVDKLNFANNFNKNSRYLEDKQKLQKDRLINTIIIFIHTKYLIKHYLLELEKV